VAASEQFYVAPNGRPDGDGSIERPWDLVTALAQPDVVKPGDTIWLRGGVYRGTFTSRLTGTPAAPIIVRQYPGERATIDANTLVDVPALWVPNGYTWFWGFEVTNSNPTRLSDADIRSNGVQVEADGVKLINLVVHDHRSALAIWDNAHNTEAYGNILYFNGWQRITMGAKGHSIYAQNVTGTKKLLDNLCFSNFGWGIHIYSSAPGASGIVPNLNNFDVEGNICFNNGELGDAWRPNILLGGEMAAGVAQNNTLRSNYTYYSNRLVGGFGGYQGIDLGYALGCNNTTVQNNYFINYYYYVLKLTNCTNTALTGNTFWGNLSGFSPADFPSNTYLAAPPSGTKIIVRPNTYEPGRAHIAVYNWDLLDSVDVEVSGILPVGAQYEVRNAQDYFGLPVLTGTYDGRPLRLPMTGLRVAAPVGNVTSKPATTGPEFAVFVLLRRL